MHQLSYARASFLNPQRPPLCDRFHPSAENRLMQILIFPIPRCTAFHTSTTLHFHPSSLSLMSPSPPRNPSWDLSTHTRTRTPNTRTRVWCANITPTRQITHAHIRDTAEDTQTISLSREERERARAAGYVKRILFSVLRPTMACTLAMTKGRGTPCGI